MKTIKKRILLLFICILWFLNLIMVSPIYANNSWFWTRAADSINLPWWANEFKWEWLIDVIKWIVNWVLGILSLVALIILLRWWFQMVTAAWDESKYKKWFTILKQAAIWIIFIWVSWFIVSLIFAVITWVTN